ncbi:MAG: hypothetical protein C0475_03700 [Planctomyces sp.]|nr:hypothetical protein [Planctomyces sp.]MBA4119580.1 hypothetical protein [Isosphaera sp.]
MIHPAQSQAGGVVVEAAVAAEHPPVALGAPTAWTSLTLDTGCDTMLFDDSARLVWSPPALRYWPNELAGAAALGRWIGELFQGGLGAELSELIRRTAQTARPSAFECFVGRSLTRSILRHAGPARPHGPGALLVTRAVTAADSAAAFPPPGAELRRLANAPPSPLADLTPREIEVLGLIALGLSTEAIAARLFRSPKTIEAHRQSLGLKLDAHNRVELARIAIDAGLLATTPAKPQTPPGEPDHTQRAAS